MSITDRRAHERARRKDEILQAARAVFAADGWHRATVDAIAERAEVSKGTIYLYFESKEAILAELVLQALRDLASELKQARATCSVLHPEQQLRAMADAYLAFAEKAPDYFRLLTTYDSGNLQQGVSEEQQRELLAQSQCTLEMVSEVIADGIALGIFLPGDARQMAAVLWAALNGALALLAHPVRRRIVPGTAHDFYHATLALCLRGIAGGNRATVSPRQRIPWGAANNSLASEDS